VKQKTGKRNKKEKRKNKQKTDKKKKAKMGRALYPTRGVRHAVHTDLVGV
jgi:hypothetical protein